MPNLDTGLRTVMITERLHRRRPRTRNRRSEARLLDTLTRELQRDPRRVPQQLVEAARRLCDAGTAAISRLKRRPQADYLYWMAVAGQLSPQTAHVQIVTPRDYSTCGAVLETQSPQLFHCPGRHFTYLNGLGAPIVELLVAPVYACDRPAGTIWVARHDPDERPFDAGDLRVLVSLAGFAAAMLQLLDESPAVSPRPQAGAVRAVARRATILPSVSRSPQGS